MEYLSQALWITVAGMGLVFLGILALWGLMALLVNVFADRKKNDDNQSAKSIEGVKELERKRLAAAAAVACGLEMQTESISVSTHKERELISAWQAAHRSQQIYKNASFLPYRRQGKKS
jgi:Na+-transporting methylmalonyl-CoA/oxaloacetate decarboxylase gamma subunit